MGHRHSIDQSDPAYLAGRREERQRQDGYAKSSKISELEAEIERLRLELTCIEQLQAMMEKLDKTKDSVWVVPGVDQVYLSGNPEALNVQPRNYCCNIHGAASVSDCYSTHEAAKAAEDE